MDGNEEYAYLYLFQAESDNLVYDGDFREERVKPVEVSDLKLWYGQNTNAPDIYPKKFLADAKIRNFNVYKISEPAPTAAPITTRPAGSSEVNKTPWALNMRIEYQQTDDQNKLLERKCMGTLIADNVILTSSKCCENIRDFSIIDSEGGTNGAIAAISVNSGAGWMKNNQHGKAAVTERCKYGQKANGKCKKAGRRRRDEGDGEFIETICVIKAPYNVVEIFGAKPIQECFKK